MNSFVNMVLLNATVGVGMALVVWALAMIPPIRRRPNLRHWLWVIVLCKFVTPPVFELSLLPSRIASDQQPVTQPRVTAPDEFSASPVDIDVPASSKAISATRATIDWSLIAFVIAVTGSVGVIVRAMTQQGRLRQALRQGATNDERLSRIAEATGRAMGLKSPPPVVVVATKV